MKILYVESCLGDTGWSGILQAAVTHLGHHLVTTFPGPPGKLADGQDLIIFDACQKEKLPDLIRPLAEKGLRVAVAVAGPTWRETKAWYDAGVSYSFVKSINIGEVVASVITSLRSGPPNKHFG